MVGRGGSLLLAFMTVPVLAGCVDDPPAPTPNDDAVPPPPIEPLDFINASLPSGEGARLNIANFIMTHPYRDQDATVGESFVVAARDDLERELQGFGLRVERQNYGTGVNILGFRDGTASLDQWVVFSAHYDTAASTVFGGWDDGAGTALLLELARTLGTWPTPFTLVFAFFDQEEDGLVGSRNFVKEYHDKVDLVANLNTDPPGLNWPCGDPLGPFPVKILYNQTALKENVPRDVWLHDAIELGLNATDVPVAVRDYSAAITLVSAGQFRLGGSSDHVSFGRAGIANMFLGGFPHANAGPAELMTYSLHSPLDTLQQMEARCGGADQLAAGLGTVASTFAHAIAEMARSGAPRA